MGGAIEREELQELAKLLRKRHAELRAEEGVLTGYIRGEAPQGDDILEVREDIDAIEKVGEIEETELHLVEEALDRIAKNIYGRCLACGERIPVERLRIMPHARYCVYCEKKREGDNGKERR